MSQELRQDILDLSRQTKIGTLSPWFEDALEHHIANQNYLNDDELERLGGALIDDLSHYRQSNNLKTVVLGMSGGVDSALTAALFKAAGWHVIGHTLPIEQDPEETERGAEACDALGIERIHYDLTDQYKLMVVALGRQDQKLHETGDRSYDIRRGNIRARLRMITLYDQAHRHGGIVGSTDNLSEMAAGFWTLHGDVGDVAPIQSLLKSWEVPALASKIGVPERTWRATPTDGLGISNGDEEQLGASYLEWDLMMLSLMELTSNSLVQGKADLKDKLDLSSDTRASEVFDAFADRMGRTWFKRSGTMCIPHTTANRFADLGRLDGRLQ